MPSARPSSRGSAAHRSWSDRLRRGSRVALVLVTGCGLGLLGFVLLFLPGPGVPLIFAGLTVLSTELTWADRLLQRLRTPLARLGRRPGPDPERCGSTDPAVRPPE